jgi:RNA polymerase sigma-70 factor (ECF subfamily)
MGAAIAVTAAGMAASSVRAPGGEIDRDAQLMSQVRQGDLGCFSLLVERHRSPVIHFVYRMVQNQGVAEELAQEVFVRLYRARESYEPSAKFTTWMFRIAAHLSLNWIRDHKGERGAESLDHQIVEGAARQVADREANVEERMLREVKLEEVRRAIEQLPEKQRAAVLMHKYEEMDYSQIAKVLECSESALKSLLFRAYETLRLRLAHLAGAGREA